jgi:hypothetical protein
MEESKIWLVVAIMFTLALGAVAGSAGLARDPQKIVAPKGPEGGEDPPGPPLRPGEVVLRTGYMGTNVGLCFPSETQGLEDLLICNYREAVFVRGKCSTKEDCNRTAEQADVCKDHDGVNTSKTEALKPGSEESCWGECGDGTKWFALCNNYVLRLPVMPKRGRQPRRGSMQ